MNTLPSTQSFIPQLASMATFVQPSSRFVPDGTRERQWDARFNLHAPEDLGALVAAIKSCWDEGKLNYILIGGVEVGEFPNTDDYGIQHVHVAAIFKELISKRAILNAWNIKRGNGYYLVPRNRTLPYAGWRSHHTKRQSKQDPDKPILYEMGTLPKDKEETTIVKRSEQEKKRKLDEILIEMRGMYANGQDEECFTKFPRTALQYGEKIKAMLHQSKDKLKSSGDPHIWIYGDPGLGKSAILNFIYPNTYKKNLYNRFFDLYDDKIHDHILLEDLDHDAVDKLSTNFIKTLCDESGFPVDQKYKTPQLTRSTILVTSNFTIDNVIGNSKESNVFGKQKNTEAILRRFYHINIRNFLRVLQVKLISSYEIKMLKKQGNTDPAALFMTWDWEINRPLCIPLKTPQEYAELIKQHYYQS